MADLMQVITKVAKERVFGARTGQEPFIGRQRIQKTKEAEALYEFAHEGIYGHHAFRFEFAEWHVNRPLTWAGGAQAVEGQIGTLTDAHAGVAHWQNNIAAPLLPPPEP